MATKEQYEQGAKNLATKVKETKNLLRKSEELQYLGNLRWSQYWSTGEERTRKLAINCYKASERLYSLEADSRPL